MALTRSLFHTHMNSGGKRTGIMTLSHRVLRVPAPKAATLLTPEGIGHKGYLAKCSSGVSPAVALTLFWGGLMLLVQNGLYQASSDKMREKNHIHLLKKCFQTAVEHVCFQPNDQTIAHTHAHTHLEGEVRVAFCIWQALGHYKEREMGANKKMKMK